jgi:DNA polymerase-3 subunit alpha (Gram-positive type)
LGHDDPTAIKLLQTLTGVDPVLIPNNDKKVISLFNSPKALNIEPKDILGEKTGVMGIPEFGTKFVRKMLNSVEVKSFQDLVSVSGLSHGTDVWTNNGEVLVKDFNLKLHDIISCRDDIMVDLIDKNIEPKIAFEIMERVRKGKSINEEQEKLMIKNKVPN